LLEVPSVLVQVRKLCRLDPYKLTGSTGESYAKCGYRGYQETARATALLRAADVSFHLTPRITFAKRESGESQPSLTQ
jgi:hypothetical protein